MARCIPIGLFFVFVFERKEHDVPVSPCSIRRWYPCLILLFKYISYLYISKICCTTPLEVTKLNFIGPLVLAQTVTRSTVWKIIIIHRDQQSLYFHHTSAKFIWILISQTMQLLSFSNSCNILLTTWKSNDSTITTLQKVVGLCNYLQM